VTRAGVGTLTVVLDGQLTGVGTRSARASCQFLQFTRAAGDAHLRRVESIVLVEGERCLQMKVEGH